MSVSPVSGKRLQDVDFSLRKKYISFNISIPGAGIVCCKVWNELLKPRPLNNDVAAIIFLGNRRINLPKRDGVSIGSVEGNDIVINFPLIDSHHALIVHTGDEIRVMNLSDKPLVLRDKAGNGRSVRFNKNDFYGNLMPEGHRVVFGLVNGELEIRVETGRVERKQKRRASAALVPIERKPEITNIPAVISGAALIHVEDEKVGPFSSTSSRCFHLPSRWTVQRIAIYYEKILRKLVKSFPKAAWPTVFVAWYFGIPLYDQSIFFGEIPKENLLYKGLLMPKKDTPGDSNN